MNTIPLQRVYAAAMLLLVSVLAGGARGGPPFVTDDPDPTEYKHWEIYTFATFNHTSGVDFAQIPALEINYGLIPDVQLHAVTPLAYDRMPAGKAHYGYGDTELGVKYRFVHETDSLPEVGIFPLVEIPSGDSHRGLGNGNTQVFAPIWLQKSFGKDKDWTTFGGGGFWYNPGHDRRNFFRVGWEIQHDLSKFLTPAAEIYHESKMNVGDRGHTAFNVGGYINFDEHNHVLFSVGRDIDGPNRFSSYLAYQLTF